MAKRGESNYLACCVNTGTPTRQTRARNPGSTTRQKVFCKSRYVKPNGVFLASMEGQGIGSAAVVK